MSTVSEQSTRVDGSQERIPKNEPARTRRDPMSVRKLPVLQADEAVACCAPLAAVELSEPDAKTLAEQFAALADPVWLRLVSLLATAPDGAICVCDLVEPIGKS